MLLLMWVFASRKLDSGKVRGSEDEEEELMNTLVLAEKTLQRTERSDDRKWEDQRDGKDVIC